MRYFAASLFLLISFSLGAANCPFSSFTKGGGAVVVQDATTSAVVLSCGNAEKAYKYASTIKLFTTATALAHLGRDFQFTTEFLFSPKEKLLTIVSSGDPSMVIEQLTVVAGELKKRGITSIKSVRVLSPGWNGKSEREQRGAGKGDRAYQAPISALSLNFNTVTVSVLPTKKGEKPRISVGIPPAAFIIKNQAKSVPGSGNSLVVSATPIEGKTVITVTGSIGINRAKPAVSYRRIYHPAHHYIYTLLALMGNKMVPIEISAGDIPLNEKHRTLYTHKSRPLHDILTDMNRYSNNFIAETVTATLGIREAGDPANGVTAIKKFIKKEYGFEPNIMNGSGLGNGEYNFVTPMQIITLLQGQWKDKWNAIDFFSTLPVYGETGTLHHAPHTNAIGNIRAKTGTLSGSSAASGVFRGKNGKIYLFTIILSDSSVRRLTTKRNQILSQLVGLF